MDVSSAKKPAKLKKQLIEIAYSPIKFRVAVTLVLVGAWYGAFGMSHTEKIDTTTKEVVRERKRLDLAKSIENLRKQVGRFENRIPKDPDPNEWVQYMLSGSRLYALKVANLDTSGRKDAGPFKAVVIKMDVEGSFRDIDGFLRWIESNQRVLRVDSISLAPEEKTGDSLGKMKGTLVILGLFS